MPSAQQMLSSLEAFADGHLAALDKQLGLSEELKPPLRSVFLREGNVVIVLVAQAESHPVTR